MIKWIQSSILVIKLEVEFKIISQKDRKNFMYIVDALSISLRQRSETDFVPKSYSFAILRHETDSSY